MSIVSVELKQLYRGGRYSRTGYTGRYCRILKVEDGRWSVKYGTAAGRILEE